MLLIIVPIVQLAMKPILCCAQVKCTERILSEIKKERELNLTVQRSEYHVDMLAPSPYP